MSVSVYFRNRKKRTETLHRVCFGFLDRMPENTFTTNTDIIFKEGTKIGYLLYTQASVQQCLDYIKVVKTAGFLKEIKVQVRELDLEEKAHIHDLGIFNTVVRCEASTELPGQEIIGKFEMLRPLHYWYLPSSNSCFVNAVMWFWEQGRSTGTLYHRYRAMRALVLPSLLQVSDSGGTTAISCQVLGNLYNPSTDIDIVVQGSRAITKSYRESHRFYGIFNYFLGYHFEDRQFKKFFDKEHPARNHTRCLGRTCTKEQALEWANRGLLW